MKKKSINKIWIITIFAIAMGFLEAAVVYYLRELFYPNGFNFPLIGFINPSILGIEWLREFATIVMLTAIACLAAKKFYLRFAYFLYAFAIWDIFYYIFLKLTLNWPSSFFTWDILFMIPWPWVGPVLAPVICSLLFIILALIIINFEDNKKSVKFSITETTSFISAIILILYTWLYDYAILIFQKEYAKSFFTLGTNKEFMDLILTYTPAHYNWPLFLIAIMLAIFSIISFYIRNSRPKLLKRK